jgi:hypothetical protein
MPEPSMNAAQVDQMAQMTRDPEEPHSEPLAPPRGRLCQDDEFRVDDLAGETLERIVGYVNRESREPEMLLLKPRGRHWQRCFIDAGLCSQLPNQFVHIAPPSTRYPPDP